MLAPPSDFCGTAGDVPHTRQASTHRLSVHPRARLQQRPPVALPASAKPDRDLSARPKRPTAGPSGPAQDLRTGQSLQSAVPRTPPRPQTFSAASQDIEIRCYNHFAARQRRTLMNPLAPGHAYVPTQSPMYPSFLDTISACAVTRSMTCDRRCSPSSSALPVTDMAATTFAV